MSEATERPAQASSQKDVDVFDKIGLIESILKNGKELQVAEAEQVKILLDEVSREIETSALIALRGGKPPRFRAISPFGASALVLRRA